MRRVRYSLTFIEQLDALIAQGEPKFGTRVVDQKRAHVFDTVDNFLAHFPGKIRDPELGLCVHAISKTPFSVIYDFTAADLDVFFLVHSHADRSSLDPSRVVW